MSKYRQTFNSIGNKIFAPLVQKWQLESGSDKELSVQVGHKNSYLHNQPILDNRATFTSEFFNGECTFRFDAYVRSLLRDKSVDANRFTEETGWEPMDGITHEESLFTIAYLPMPSPAHYDNPITATPFLLVNATAKIGEDVAIDYYRLLTSFKRLHRYEGFPLTVSFIAPMRGSQATAYVIQDGVAMSHDGEKVLFPTDYGQHYTIEVYASQSIAIANTMSDIYLRNVDGTLITDNIETPIEVADYILYEHFPIDARIAPEHPFYVRWINAQGGYDYWMFACKQTIHRELKGITTHTPYLETMDVRADKVIIAQEIGESVTCSTGMIDADEWQAISKMLYSPKIELYKDGKWFTILLEKGSAEINTTSPTAEMQLSFTLPTPNIQL